MRLIDPGSRVVDYLRACYSTDMVLSQDGHHSHVDWYFTDAGAPGLGKRSVMTSLHYRRPDLPAGSLGEVPSASRPWRDGSRPLYIGPHDLTYSTGGTDADWINGVVGDYGPVDVDYAGRKLFPYTGAPGIFPPLPFVALNPPLLSSTRGLARQSVPAIPGTTYVWDWAGRSLRVIWTRVSGGLWSCFPGRATLFTSDPPAPGVFLRCLSYDAVNAVSIWDDPSGLSGAGHLDPGERLTIFAGTVPEDYMLLATLTAAGSADLRYTGFTSGFDIYELHLENITPTNSGVLLGLQFTKTGGVTWLSANYYWTDWGFEPGGGGLQSGSNVDRISFGGAGREPSNVTADGGLSGVVRIYNPLSTARHTLVEGHRAYRAPAEGDRLSAGHLAGSYDVTADSINGFRLLFAAGTIASGVVRVYGLAQ